MPTAELDIKIGKVDAQDVLQMVVRQFQGGSQIVFLEKQGSHKIYLSSELMRTIGGYEATNELVRKAFDAVSETDETKTRFYFGENYVLGNHEVCGFEIYFPRLGGHRSLEETQEKFLQAVKEKITNN